MKAKKLIESTMCVKFKRTLNESAEDTKAKWSAPIWNLDKKNLNGHTYTKALAERVVKDNITTTAHDGHNDERGEYELAKAVCSHPHIENKQLWVDIEFIDKEYEEKINTLYNKGVAIGVSSTGYGTEDDNGILDSESYIVLRYLDFVEMPAGEVYLTQNKSEKRASVPNVDNAMAKKREQLTNAYRVLENKIQNIV